jgi:hypothetical protein
MKMYQYMDSKNFILDAKNEDDGRRCFALEINEMTEKQILIVYFSPENSPDTEVGIYNSLQELAENYCWESWIFNGVKDEELEELVLKELKKKR